ncbi:MAG: hypothetical protein ACRD50_11775 [Candidatus Acidiferrales bacterium]
MTYQLRWKILPGLRGLSCSEFQATAVEQPDHERGVAVELGSEAEAAELIAALEAQFGAERFSNTAAAFDTVKTFVFNWAASKQN